MSQYTNTPSIALCTTQMDEEMEDTCTYEYTFTVIEIDLDYEFDAPRYFDFRRGETPAEAREAQSWYHSAGSYPPSPFVVKQVPRLDMLMENVNTSPKRKDADNTSMSDSDSDVDVNGEVSVPDVKKRGGKENGREASINVQTSSRKSERETKETQTELTFHNHSLMDNLITKVEPAAKPSFPRGSTLMKPTESHLAKQYKSQQTSGLRFLKSFDAKNQKGSGNHSLIEVQAAKRQKLEGGHLRKIGETNQQINFVHKEPKKNATGYINTMQGKRSVTIPREPQLEIANRAQRMRSKASKDADTAVPRFRARPLNRKILESPSLFLKKRITPLVGFQEFHLKTSERATKHTLETSTSTVPSTNFDKVPHKCRTCSTAEYGSEETIRPKLADASKQGSHLVLDSKALPNNKMFTCRGDPGVLQNTKEPRIQTERRSHHYPPVELFNKLSLASDPQPSARSHLKPPMSACLFGKGTKENRWNHFSRNEMSMPANKNCIGLETRSIIVRT